MSSTKAYADLCLHLMEKPFNVGQIVYHLKHPGIQFIILRNFYIVYYCRKVSDPESKEQVFFERELSLKPH